MFVVLNWPVLTHLLLHVCCSHVSWRCLYCLSPSSRVDARPDEARPSRHMFDASHTRSLHCQPGLRHHSKDSSFVGTRGHGYRHRRSGLHLGKAPDWRLGVVAQYFVHLRPPLSTHTAPTPVPPDWVCANVPQCSHNVLYYSGNIV